MRSFADFVISFMNVFGITWMFSVVLVTIITYLFILLMFRNLFAGEGKESKYENLVKLLSLIVAISFGILFGSVAKAYIVIQYFASIWAVLFVIIFILLMGYGLVAGKNGLQVKNKTAIVASLIILSIIFIFVGVYFAYQEEIISMNAPSSGGLDIIGLVFRPEILAVPFIFSILGLLFIVLLREPKSKEK